MIARSLKLVRWTLLPLLVVNLMTTYVAAPPEKPVAAKKSTQVDEDEASALEKLEASAALEERSSGGKPASARKAAAIGSAVPSDLLQKLEADAVSQEVGARGLKVFRAAKGARRAAASGDSDQAIRKLAADASRLANAAKGASSVGKPATLPDDRETLVKLSVAADRAEARASEKGMSLAAKVAVSGTVARATLLEKLAADAAQTLNEEKVELAEAPPSQVAKGNVKALALQKRK